MTAAIAMHVSALIDGLEDERDNGVKMLNTALSDIGYQIVRVQ